MALLTLLAASCGDHETQTTPPVDLGLEGGFLGEVQSGNRLVLKAADGRVLLDGLAVGTVPADGPPLVGFATREVTTTYEMQFGAFKPTAVAEGSWQVAQELKKEASGLTLLGANDEELARLAFSSPEEGHLVIEVKPGPNAQFDPNEPASATKLSWGFACDKADHFAGFGAQTWDADHRGQTVPTFVTEGGIGKSETDDYSALWMLQGQRHSSHAPLPEYLSSRGYLFVAETDRRATFALCSEAESAARVEIDMPAILHVFDGPEPAVAIERATGVFGRPRMPPPVAFAPWLDAVFGSENVRRVAQKLRDELIPVSVIWTEDWRGGDWEGENYALKEEWEVDRTLYPDIEAVADDLHGLGFDFHVYFNPFIYMDSKAWTETEPNGYLVKKTSGEPYTFTGAKFTECGLIDLDNPDARAWASSKMEAAIALGADGWMNDFAEWLPTDGVTAAGPSYMSHNLYPVQWQEVARAAIDAQTDGVQRLFFGRSGWFGTPALTDVFWAGDQRTTFDEDDGFPTLIPQAIGLGIVGISTYGHDIAGYQSATNPGSTKELFFRWTSLGAWSPVMRTHHGNQPNKEWSWEKDADTIAHFKRYAELHMSLVPTLTALAREAADTGMPMWRGLALHYPEDAAVWPIKDQILLGRSIMISPVIVEGASSRPVYFPEGRWFDWNGEAAVDGPLTETVESSMEEIAVYARAGAIVPMYPDGVMTLVRGSAEVPDASLVGDDRIVRVFLGDSGNIVEDGGLAYELTALAELGDSLSLEFEGEGADQVKLAACDSELTAPCVETNGREIVAHVLGAGKFTVLSGQTAAAEFVVSGGDPGRVLTVRFRH